eukprot:11185630-Lingulodinium_polyedra.AAC.1
MLEPFWPIWNHSKLVGSGRGDNVHNDRAPDAPDAVGQRETLKCALAVTKGVAPNVLHAYLDMLETVTTVATRRESRCESCPCHSNIALPSILDC